MLVAVMARTVPWWAYVTNVLVVTVGNSAGCLVIAGLFGKVSRTFVYPPPLCCSLSHCTDVHRTGVWYLRQRTVFYLRDRIWYRKKCNADVRADSRSWSCCTFPRLLSLLRLGSEQLLSSIVDVTRFDFWGSGRFC